METLSVNGKFLSQPVTGVQRYAAGLVRGWDKGLDEGWIDRRQYSIRVIVPRTILRTPNYKHVAVEVSRTNGRLWEQIELPWRARGTMLFSPYAAAPILKLRHSVTIHDAAAAAAPRQYSRAFKAYCAVVFRALGYNCAPIFTDSEFSRRELHRYFSIPVEKIKVVFPGCDHLWDIAPDSSILERAGLKKNQFVLGVSSQSVIKNFEGLSKAWTMSARPGMKLAIAGRTHSSLFGTKTAAIDDNVVMLGYVSDSELRSLYENAALFAYPSFYEGFGIPPVEAMGCGCPVLVARSSSLPEACGDAAIYCDPANVCDIAKNISRILDDPDLAQQLQKLGFNRSAELTADRSAMMLWSELQPFI